MNVLRSGTYIGVKNWQIRIKSVGWNTVAVLYWGLRVHFMPFVKSLSAQKKVILANVSTI